MTTVAFQTLGCKLNQYETDSIAAQFQQAGYTIVPFDQSAQVYIINTCTVTNKADRKSRNVINRALRQSSKSLVALPVIGTPEHSVEPDDSPSVVDPPSGTDNSLVVVTGCFANSSKEELEKDGRTLVVENEYKTHIFELVDAHLKGEILSPSDFAKDVFTFTPQEQVFHTRGMIKIQDGCDNFCTFCIIPYVRGKAVSRPLPHILSEAQTLISQGYKELVLTGVNMSRYDWEGKRFSHVLEALLALETQENQNFRVRISSIEPDQIDERFFQLMNHPRMCPHLHLCLQSGSERILLAMRRQYTYGLYRSIAQRLRNANPKFNITTDIILGFPGEQEQEFDETLHAVEELQFGHVHIFPYSKRKGTRAERFPNHVNDQEKSSRSTKLSAISEESKRAYRSSLIGTTQQVLIEKVEVRGEKLVVRGLGEYYVPVRFYLPRTRNQESVRNQFFPVKILGLAPGADPDLVGEVDLDTLD